MRRHFALRSKPDNVVHYEVTIITRTADEFDQDLILVDDPGHGRVVMEMKHTYTDQEVYYSISDDKRKDFVRTSFTMPFTAKTRAAMLKEAARSPQLKELPALLTVTTNAGEWRGVDSEWGEWQRLREIRHSIRPTLPFHLLESIERMRGALLASPSGSIYYSTVARFVVYQSNDDARLDLEEIPMDPSCTFDSSFGYPCSEAQLARVKKAAAANKPLREY